MKERPILMSPPMVQALQREVDPKTQTRRTKGLEHINQNPDAWKVIRPLQEYEPLADGSGMQHFPGWAPGYWLALKNPEGIEDMGYMVLSCPYGVPGDRLWVKETYYAFGCWKTRFNQKKGRDEWFFVDISGETLPLSQGYRYFDDPPPTVEPHRSTRMGWHKRSSLFMPRAASRLTLDITRIGAEPLQNISVSDAIAEGIESFRPVPGDGEPNTLYRNYETGRWTRNPIHSYQTLWEEINGPDAWDANPWVWPITFQKIQPTP